MGLGEQRQTQLSVTANNMGNILSKTLALRDLRMCLKTTVLRAGPGVGRGGGSPLKHQQLPGLRSAFCLSFSKEQ